MKNVRLILVFAIFLSAGCAQRDIFLATMRTDPTPLMETLRQRNETLSTGLAGELDMDFKDSERHYRGDGFVILTPTGKLRLEVPGLFGSTVLLLVSDGTSTTVYYPSDSKAFRTTDSTYHLSSLLPFPMPFSPPTLAQMLTGTVVPDGESERVSAFDGASGQRMLVFVDEAGSEYRYLFSAGPTMDLSQLSVTLDTGELTVIFSPQEPQLTERFTYTNGDTRMKGRFQRARIVEGIEGSIFTLDLPSSVTIKELDENR